MKEKLTLIDKQRLGELVMVYMNPTDFFIHNSGMVTLSKANWIKRMFNIRDEFDTEFISITKDIIAGILEKKGANPFITHRIITKIGAILLNTYNAAEVIRLLYLMHIIEEEDVTIQKQNTQQSNSKPKSIEISIEQGRQGNTRKQEMTYFAPGMRRSDYKELVEGLLNEADIVIVDDNRY